jgi:hypothetical protein
MRRWAWLVAALYALVLFAFMFPLGLAAFAGSPDGRPAQVFAQMLAPQLWIIIGVMTLAQFALLRVPVLAAAGRPLARGPLWVTVLAATAMMGVLVYGAGLVLLEAINHQDLAVVALYVGAGSWGLWAVYFFHATRDRSPSEVTHRVQRVLWAGSILELLVAIPTHIVARHRHECCAGFLTFLGLACGMSVMLFAFGPSLYFLFASRWKRLHPSSEPMR